MYRYTYNVMYMCMYIHVHIQTACSSLNHELYSAPPDTWIEHGNIQYYFSANEETRDNAQSCCQAAGAHLSSVTSWQEWDFIRDRFVLCNIAIVDWYYMHHISAQSAFSSY